MKKVIFTISLFLSFWSCSAQVPVLKNMESNSEMNYIFARINPAHILQRELFNGGLYITVYSISDSNATPKNNMEDFLTSYIISVVPDGDYYSQSKLYKIEGLYNPKILQIKESKAPDFIIKIEYGAKEKMNTKIFELNSVN